MKVQKNGFLRETIHTLGRLVSETHAGFEDWCYDASGNWQKYGNDDESLLQTRTHNAANEITSVANPTGVIVSPKLTPFVIPNF